MRCIYCQRETGLLRSLFGFRFCCSDHRKNYQTRSARVLRDSVDLFAGETWSEQLAEVDTKPRHPQGGYAAAGWICVCVAALALALTRTSAKDGNQPVSLEHHSLAP